ncbi:uncharacterized protein TRIADDRAFT_57048 [Trichoplax adhaerens]|uniref:Uncharacterized protein n=1 Tax=Trichoplax adhaerens TaxID=10228 RepID=B3S0H3_TRIAD|nr:predicted protein [Trichoplax adhaerens]EDV23641.1 predicted protein [Trichoplax adhaerens]|eukprot:XP_002113167.1 predicted protein [Trichoplax adhaerens]
MLRTLKIYFIRISSVEANDINYAQGTYVISTSTCGSPPTEFCSPDGQCSNICNETCPQTSKLTLLTTAATAASAVPTSSSAPGSYTSSYNFDGSTYYTVQQKDEPTTLQVQGGFSITIWTKPQTSSVGRFFMKEAQGTSNGIYMSLVTNTTGPNKHLSYWYQDDNNQLSSVTFSNIALDDNLWHLVTIIIYNEGGFDIFTQQYSKPSISLYIDKTLRYANSRYGGKPKYGLGTFTIGKGVQTGDNYKGINILID